MAGDWVEAHPAAATLFARASRILGYDLLDVCRTGPVERLNSTAVSQPGILVTSLAALEVLRSRPDDPLASATITAGLSLGEYTALVFAGALEFDAAVRLVDVRGRAMCSRSPTCSALATWSCRVRPGPAAGSPLRPRRRGR
jgi:[acyl-carrier-protein] S-malonyltransferase